MSLPLKDLRTGISENTHAALEARAVADGTDIQTVAREVLQQWAAREHRAYMVYMRRVLANGGQAELPGLMPEDDGTKRNRR